MANGTTSNSGSKTEGLPLYKKIIIGMWAGVVFLLITTAVALYGISQGWLGELPSAQDLMDPINKSASRVYTDDGMELCSWGYAQDNRVMVPYDSLPDNLIKALVATEDVRFYDHSGIDIKAQPPGKKMLQLNLLSGGERSMTAVALLFATYMVKPSPFCILDEIDAALDTRNIGAFMRVLDKFEDKSQFIIITHNKGTVMGSDCLLGVTQQEPGVSKMIGYKIEDIENLDEHDTLKG